MDYKTLNTGFCYFLSCNQWSVICCNYNYNAMRVCLLVYTFHNTFEPECIFFYLPITKLFFQNFISHSHIFMFEGFWNNLKLLIYFTIEWQSASMIKLLKNLKETPLICFVYSERRQRVYRKSYKLHFTSKWNVLNNCKQPSFW